MIIKLDTTNDFDKVRHDFLLQIMKIFGFEDQFVKWVFLCINSHRISPIMNGSASRFFWVY